MLNKADLADPATTRAWVERYLAEGFRAIPADCRTGEGVPEAIAAAIDASEGREKTPPVGKDVIRARGSVPPCWVFLMLASPLSSTGPPGGAGQR